jgi:hypothetical protein
MGKTVFAKLDKTVLPRHAPRHHARRAGQAVSKACCTCSPKLGPRLARMTPVWPSTRAPGCTSTPLPHSPSITRPQLRYSTRLPRRSPPALVHTHVPCAWPRSPPISAEVRPSHPIQIHCRLTHHPSFKLPLPPAQPTSRPCTISTLQPASHRIASRLLCHRIASHHILERAMALALGLSSGSSTGLQAGPSSVAFSGLLRADSYSACAGGRG